MFGFRTGTSRTILFQFIAVAALFAGFIMPASSQAVAPVLVPYSITAVAGNTQSSIPGFGGEGGQALNATLNGANAMAVDGAGNIYFADQGNAVIREVNAQTGVIQTIAGVMPTKCTGTTCTVISPGCADGVLAKGAQVGSKILGLVVDGSGNVYFADYNNQGVWVIYHGGAQLASFIGLVDATGVTTAGGVKPGYMYHIAGMSAPKPGGGCTNTLGNKDQVLATLGSFHDPGQMGIDAAGNLYVEDYANGVVRAINTQSTTQTILGTSVMPGYIAAVTGCNAVITYTCPATIPPFGGPANKAVFSSTLVGATADQYGNVYEIDTAKANGGIYTGVAYAGGTALAHLINLESGLTASAGNWYEVINSVSSPNGLPGAVQAVLANNSSNLTLRPVSVAVDPLGNIYMLDSHWIAIYRTDVNSQMATRVNGLSPVAAAGAFCSGTSGPKSTDAYGDGCPVSQAKINGYGYVTFDPSGNLYLADTGNNIIRKVSVGTQFPSTAVGSSMTQTVEIHFDAGNLPPATGGFALTSGGGDFAISSSPCSNNTSGLDASQECYVTIVFTPSATGLRNASLQAKAANGSVYSFAISGFGAGPQLAVDGGLPSTVPVSGLGTPSALATDALGNTYIADAANHRVVVISASGAQSTVGTGLSAPQGVAVDAVGNVFISDAAATGARILEVSGSSQTVLTTNVNNPNGIAVDRAGNVYVADTGNERVLEISPFGEFGFTTVYSSKSAAPLGPVGVAIDKSGNVFVADSGNPSGLIQIGPSGGDLQTVPGGATLNGSASLLSFGTAFVAKPSGVAVDAAGNLYVADQTGNKVQVLPGGSGPGGEPYTLNLPGMIGPTGLALDFSGNLYVADSGNGQVLFQNRSNINVNFGTGYLFQPPLTDALTVLNIGSAALTPTSPFAQLTGSAPADFNETDSCGSSNFPSGTLSPGLHCSETVSFNPLVRGPLSATVNLQGGVAKVNVSGVGAAPLATLNLALTSPAGGAVYGQPAVVTLTATQPSGTNVVPSGTVTFNYTVNGTSQAPITQTLAPNGNGGSTTSLTFNNLLRGRKYVITATYNGDAQNSPTTASFTFIVPGYPLTAVSTSVSYTYGGSVPALTGTVTGILPADQATIAVSFTSDATPSTPVGTYPIRAVLSGGNYQDYTIPATLTSSGSPALVTEMPAPLSIVGDSFKTLYGQPQIGYSVQVTGLVNGDKSGLHVSYTPAFSSKVPVGTYSIVPTVTIPDTNSYDKIHNYTVSTTNGTLVVTQATSALSISPAATAVLPTALSSGTITIGASNAGDANGPAGFIGTPTGTITLNDLFTPLTAMGSGTPVNEPPVVLNLSSGTASYTPTDPTIGIHTYTFSYNGDSNFMASNTSATPTTLIIDNADFSIVSTSSPVQVAPGILPGGLAAVAGEQAATPEIATVYINPILGSTATVTLTCAVPAPYITCTIAPSSVTLTGKTTLTSVVSISVPMNLPANYTGALRRKSSNLAFAILPLALLGLIPVWKGRRRMRLSGLLTLVAAVAMLGALSGCGSNLVKLNTPVPAGPQQVTITGTSGGTTRSFVVPINIQ